MKKIFLYILTSLSAIFLVAALLFVYGVYRDKQIAGIMTKPPSAPAAANTEQRSSDYIVRGTIKIPPLLQSKIPSTGTLLITIRDPKKDGEPIRAMIENPKFPYHFAIDLTKNPLYPVSIKDDLKISMSYPLPLPGVMQNAAYAATQAVNPLDGSVPLVYLIPHTVRGLDNNLDNCDDLLKKGVSGQVKFSKILPIEKSPITLLVFQFTSQDTKTPLHYAQLPDNLHLLGYQNLNPKLAQVQNIHIPILALQNRSLHLVLADCSMFGADYKKCLNYANQNAFISGILEHRAINISAPISCRHYQNIKLYLTSKSNDENSLIKFMEEEFKDF